MKKILLLASICLAVSFTAVAQVPKRFLNQSKPFGSKTEVSFMKSDRLNQYQFEDAYAKKKRRKKRKKGRGGDGGFGLGAELVGIKFLGGSGIPFSPGIGIRGTFSKDGSNAFNGGVMVVFPAAYSYTVTGNAYNSLTDPQSKEFDVKVKSKAFQVIVGYTRYITGGFGEDFSFYGGGNAGMMIYSYNPTVSGNTTDYNIYGSGEKGKITGFQLRAALGIEANLGFSCLYAELEGNLPATNVGGVQVEINIPFFVGIRSGLRFNF